MASNPENVRLNVLMKLQEALDEEAILEEQILSLMHHFADRFTDRRVEINNLMVLHDHQLIDYGKYALGCMTGADMKKCVYLKSVRDELLRSHFSPQWKFFIHTILHCLSSKKTAWDQFNSNISTALICLATSRRFNFSKFIFEALIKNLDRPYKFLLYPRFIQLLLNKQHKLLLPYTRTYPTPILTNKLFSNMGRAFKGYSGVVTPLFENMLVQAHDEEQLESPSRITSSPSLS
ncbi:hypothetical protein Tco_1436113 [Tanacetum coccineum]